MALNFVAIILAITGILNPVVGALVHNAGSIMGIINSALLLRWKKKYDKPHQVIYETDVSRSEASVFSCKSARFFLRQYCKMQPEGYNIIIL